MIKYGYKQLLEGHKNHDCLECVKLAHKYGLEKGLNEGQLKAWNEMLGAINNWNKSVGKTETSIKFEFFVKNKIKGLK